MLSEEQWLTSTDPADMLHYLRHKRNARERYLQPKWFSPYKKYQAPRKLRLFLLACFYRNCHDSSDPICLQLFQLVEQYVEVPPPLLGPLKVLHPFFGAGNRVGLMESALRNPIGLAAASLRLFVGRQARYATTDRHEKTTAENAAIGSEAVYQCELLREIFGNPFRPVSLDPIWLTDVVLKIAEEIYRNQDFDRMKELTCALKEAGCDRTDLLDHFSQPKSHVRGCWALDLLLGKE